VPSRLCPLSTPCTDAEAFAEDRPADPRLGTLDQLTDVLRFRQEMHEELAK
jgi:hypothetical protein